MQSKDGLTIELNLNWQLLARLGAAALLLVLAYSAAGAQVGEPPDTNSTNASPVAEEPQSQPITIPDAPEAQDDNLVYTTNGEWVPRESIGAARPLAVDETGTTASVGSERHVYLTNTNYAANQVLTACASGYHTASFWELYDVSNLIYDYGHPAAITLNDSGIGPPSHFYGWVRTGYYSSGSSTTGTGNCLNWSSTSAANYGVSVRLSRMWETAPGDIGPWDANSFTCNTPGTVWCVRD